MISPGNRRYFTFSRYLFNIFYNSIIMLRMQNKTLDKSIQILTVIYMALFLLGSFSFAFYYPFGHLNDCDQFSFLYIFFQLIRLSAFILVPLAGFYFYKAPRNIVKTILPLLFISLFFYYPQYTSLSKLDTVLPFYNDIGLDQTPVFGI